VRALKTQALRASFRRFLDCDWRRGTPRGTALGRFIEEQAWWLEDYRLFRALHARQGEAAWTTWDEPLRTRQPEALRRARTELADEILYHAYLQWTADTQWLRARDRAGVELFGDLPFMVDLDSADVWAHQESFNLDESVGVPPDAFSATGQDWGLPAYRWEVLRERDFDWLRQRARRGAALYDGYRIDHVVGFYRTYVRTRDGARAYFNPPDQDRQLESGEMLMAVFREAGAQVIAEDLGTVPDFVRVSLTRLGIPGYRVLRWEREWKQPGQPFHDPSQYPPLSAATSGTHDTDTMAVWWEQAQPEERASLAGIPKLRDRLRGIDFNTAPYTPSVRDALLETLFASGSNLLLLPIQDIFGWRDRINEPATVSEQNWTYRLPWPSDRIRAQVEAAERAATLRKWGRQYDRLPGNSTRT
jgi:4-alpha-glucanotransferase